MYRYKKALVIGDTVLMLILSIGALLVGQATVFYMIYLFWFEELIRTFADSIYWYRNRKVLIEQGVYGSQLKPRFFLLFVYFVFIVVLFGFILNWNDTRLMRVNMKTLFLQNIFFNINLIIFALGAFYAAQRQSVASFRESGPFNSRNVVMHISIILGALFQFAVMHYYPDTYESGSTWFSVIVVAPFLLLYLGTQLRYYSRGLDD